MIRPSKYTNISLSVVGVSFTILSILNIDKFQSYDQLLGKIIYKKGDLAKVNFLPSIIFLYMLGKIKYHQEKDIIELLKN